MKKTTHQVNFKNKYTHQPLLTQGANSNLLLLGQFRGTLESPKIPKATGFPEPISVVHRPSVGRSVRLSVGLSVGRSQQRTERGCAMHLNRLIISRWLYALVLLWMMPGIQGRIEDKIIYCAIKERCKSVVHSYVLYFNNVIIIILP